MYNRLFTKILDSSIWLESDTTRLVWITFLASMDEDGFAPFSSLENLARRANIPVDDTVTAVTVLENPDKHNPDDEFEGRRIERVIGGWMVIKAPYYRTLLTREIQREQTRIRVAKHRDKRRDVTNPALHNVTSVSCNTSEHSIAEQSRVPKHLNDVLVYAKEIGLPVKEAEKFFDHYTSNGWKVSGKAPMKDWRASLRNWKRNARSPADTSDHDQRIAAARKALND